MKQQAAAIDTHAHVYPAAYLDYLESVGVDPATTKIARNLRADVTDEDMRARLDMMDKAGVSMQILSAAPQLSMVDDAKAAAKGARMINDMYADIIKQYPGRFRAYGAIALPHVGESIEEIRYCLDELHFEGIAITSLVQGKTSLADEKFLPVFEELDRRHAIVYIHPTGHGACSPLLTDYHLEWVNGAPMEDAIAVLHLMKADIPAKFPHIKFHVAHLGGDLPFLAQRIQDNYEDWGSFNSSPRETMRSMWFDAANFNPGSLRLAVETYGADKVMAGSDYPYFQDDKYTRAMSYITQAGLSDDEANAVLHDNAASLYGL